MTYNPSIPNSTDLISASQQPIKDNFTQLNTQFGIDHVAFNNGGSNGTGHHKKVQIDTPLGADPAQSGVTGAFYTKSDGTNAQAYYNNGVKVFELTSKILTYTPVIVDSNSHITFTYISQSGNYFYSGGSIFVFGLIQATWTTTPTIGTQTISLPIIAASGGQFVFGTRTTASTSTSPAIIGYTNTGQQIINCNQFITGNQATSVDIYFHGFYR